MLSLKGGWIQLGQPVLQTCAMFCHDSCDLADGVRRCEDGDAGRKPFSWKESVSYNNFANLLAALSDAIHRRDLCI